MTKIKDIVEPRKEVLEDNIKGAIHAYKVDSEEETIENDVKRFFDTTYPANTIKDIIRKINKKLTYKTDKGFFVLLGPRGSGKSHALVTLYHLFENPEDTSEWLNYWNIDFKGIEEGQSVIISAQESDPDLLWKPIFKKAGREDLLEEVDKYPTREIIEELVGEEKFAIFLDELETWFETFNEEKEKHLIKRNQMFIKILSVVANENENLFVFMTSYEVDPSSTLGQELNRIDYRAEDLSSSGDREKIVFHKLFKKPRKEVDDDKVRGVAKSYVEEYQDPIDIKNLKRYEELFVKKYPFHPQLLKVLDEIYEGVKGRQDVRGEMRVLGNALRSVYDKTDVILLSDLNEDALRSIDNTLVNKYKFDSTKRVKRIDHSEKLLKTVLFYSLEKSNGTCTKSDVLLGTFKPTAGMTLTQLDMSLGKIYGKAHYLHKDDYGDYFMSKEKNLRALIDTERKNVTEKEVREEIKNLIKKKVLDNEAYIFEFEKDEIPKAKEGPVIVVTLKKYGDEESLKAKLEDFLHGRIYQNNIVFIVPKKRSLIEDLDLKGKMKDLRAAKNLKKNMDEKVNKLKQIIHEDIKEAKTYIRNQYGYWVKWARKGETHKVRIIKEKIKLELQEIRKKIRTDVNRLEEAIEAEVKGKEGGIKVGILLKDFKKQRKYPLVSSKDVFETTLRRMTGEKIVIFGDRGKSYRDPNKITKIKENWKIKDINLVSPPEIEETEELEGETGVGEAEVPKEVEVKEKTETRWQKERSGSLRSVANKYDMSINEEKLEGIKSIKLTMNIEKMDKTQLVEFLNSLDELPESPKYTFIEAEVKLEEYEDEE